MHRIRMHPPLLLFSRGLSQSKPWSSLFGSPAASCYGGPWLCAHPPHDGVALLAALLRKMRLLILLSASRESHANIISESQCLGAGLPLFTELPRRVLLGNRASGTGRSRKFALYLCGWHHNCAREQVRYREAKENVQRIHFVL